MRRDLTPEQKKLFRDYYIDRGKLIVGQGLVLVFGLVVPAINAFLMPLLSMWISFPIAAVGVVMILTTKAYRETEEDK